MTKYEADVVVDIKGLTCPIPLIKTRRAIKGSQNGTIIKFQGTWEEEVSRKEILIALKGLKQEIMKQEISADGSWVILIEKQS